MGKRSEFERVERDYYPTPIEAVLPLLPHLPKIGLFAEPCAGDGRLRSHIEQLTPLLGYWLTDIEPMCDSVTTGNAITDVIQGCDICITNPPWNRKILHPIIENLAYQLPTWLLFDADWIKLGTHISAMGADQPGKQELPVELVLKSTLFADYPPQSKINGEFESAFKKNSKVVITPIGAVLTDDHCGRSNDQEITIFDSSGIALQDLCVAQAVLTEAISQNLTQEVEF